MTQSKSLPLIYSCSGCSSVAQLANQMALELDRAGVAEMSCIAGVGGGVPALVKKARAGRRIVALDGCHLRCCEHCLQQAGVRVDQHFLLTDFGVKKQYQTDFAADDVVRLKSVVMKALRSCDVDDVGSDTLTA